MRHWACHTLLGPADVLNARLCAQSGSFSHTPSTMMAL